jgi:hypothetical protein
MRAWDEAYQQEWRAAPVSSSSVGMGMRMRIRAKRRGRMWYLTGEGVNICRGYIPLAAVGYGP